LYVSHDEDGYWQFHNSQEEFLNSQEPNSYAEIVGLEEIVKIDATVNELYQLKEGWCVWRTEVGGKWQFEEKKE